MENPIWTGPIWSYQSHLRPVSSVLGGFDLFRGCQMSEARIGPICFCVCNSLAQHTTSLRARQADRRAVKPRRRHEILSSFLRLHSVSLCLLLFLCLLNPVFCVNGWIEEDQWEYLHRVMRILNLSKDTHWFFTFQSGRITHKLSRSTVILISQPW